MDLVQIRRLYQDLVSCEEDVYEFFQVKKEDRNNHDDGASFRRIGNKKKDDTFQRIFCGSERTIFVILKSVFFAQTRMSKPPRIDNKIELGFYSQKGGHFWGSKTRHTNLFQLVGVGGMREGSEV